MQAIQNQVYVESFDAVHSSTNKDKSYIIIQYSNGETQKVEVDTNKLDTPETLSKVKETYKKHLHQD